MCVPLAGRHVQLNITNYLVFPGSPRSTCMYMYICSWHRVLTRYIRMYPSVPDHLIRLIPARRDGEIDCSWLPVSPARARAHHRSGMSSQCISAEIDCVLWRCQDFWTRCGVLRKGHQSIVESRERGGRRRNRGGERRIARKAASESASKTRSPALDTSHLRMGR